MISSADGADNDRGHAAQRYRTAIDASVAGVEGTDVSTVAVSVRPRTAADQTWVEDLLRSSWSSLHVVSRGRLIEPATLPAFVAESGQERVGLAAYDVGPDECELVTIDATVPGRGIGTALLDAVAAEAGRQGCRRLWLITTNDNLPALRFYQRRGMRLVAVHRDAVHESRRLKPSIALTGHDGIEIHDELELELLLPTVASGPDEPTTQQ